MLKKIIRLLYFWGVLTFIIYFIWPILFTTFFVLPYMVITCSDHSHAIEKARQIPKDNLAKIYILFEENGASDRSYEKIQEKVKQLLQPVIVKSKPPTDTPMFNIGGCLDNKVTMVLRGLGKGKAKKHIYISYGESASSKSEVLWSKNEKTLEEHNKETNDNLHRRRL